MALGAPQRLSAVTRGVGTVATELAIPIVLVAVWWIGSARSEALYFPPLADIVEAFRRIWLFDHFGSDLVPSLLNLLVGYVLACALAVASGLVLGTSETLAVAVRPILEFFRAVPGVALLPIAVLLLGITAEMRISVIVYGAAWPVLLNTIDGVRGVDPVVRDMSTVYRLTRTQRVFRVVLPAATPNIMAGMRTSLSLGITLIVVSEMIGSTNGVGYLTLQAQRSYEAADMWAGMLLLGFLGYGLNVALRGIENVVLKWHHGMHAAAKG